MSPLAFVLATLAVAHEIDAAAPAYADRLAALAAKCDELGLMEQAEITRGWPIARHPGRQYLFLPLDDDPTAPTPGAPTVAQQWHAKFTELRREHADSLFANARKASDAGDAPRAYRLLFEVVRESPDHAEARRILGYAKTSRGQWVLPEWERMAAQPSRTDHPKLGWRARSFWRLETPHFQIVTNHSAKEALEAGRELEDLHALWRQLFFRYWSTPEALAARFAGGNEPLARPRPKMDVVLFKRREEYVAQLVQIQPQIGITHGYYHDRQRTAFFFAGDTSVYPIWRHEATHQLFQESVPRTTDQPGEERNFWAIEGAALYMESLQQHGTYWTGGGCESDRLQFARYYALAGAFSLPLARLTALGREEVQTSDDIRQLYSQATGIAHFLIDGEGGKRREAFVDLLSAIYRGEDAADSLAAATGEPYPALDQAYREFLNVTDGDLAAIPAVERIKNLSLGRTSVTDQGIAHLVGAKGLEWLDLSLTGVTDAGLKQMVGATKLTQLFLEGTKISEASLPVIAGFKQLEELDLTKLPLTNDGLAAIGGLRNLKLLYLSHTPVGDAGLMHLRGLRQLEMLETTGTNVTAEGRKRIEAALPKLKGG